MRRNRWSSRSAQRYKEGKQGSQVREPEKKGFWQGVKEGARKIVAPTNEERVKSSKEKMSRLKLEAQVDRMEAKRNKARYEKTKWMGREREERKKASPPPIFGVGSGVSQSEARRPVNQGDGRIYGNTERRDAPPIFGTSSRPERREAPRRKKRKRSAPRREERRDPHDDIFGF